MNPRELRIGNIVWYDSDTYTDRENKIAKNIFRVISVSEELILIDIGHDAMQRFEKKPVFSPTFDELKPVPLTKKILLAIGFIKEKDYYIYIGFKLWQSGKNTFYHINNEICIYFESLHKLQNFYFLITNEELPILKLCALQKTNP